jgi:hypothetical protein
MDDEEALSNERRAMGGDLEAQRKQVRRGDDPNSFLLDSDEED